MRNVYKLLAAVLVTLCVSMPVSAVTIKQGVYTLEWKVPKSDSEVCFASRAGTDMSVLGAEEAAGIGGLVSTRPYSGQTDRFRIILDESGGTGSGWDTAYITRVGTQVTDKAIKVPLKLQDNTLKSLSPSGTPIELSLGSADSRVTRKAALDIEVYLEAEQDGGELHPTLAMLTLRGGWYGKVAADDGDIAVQLIDFNENGTYGDLSAINTSSKLPEMGDAVIFGDPPTSFDDYSNVVYLGRVISYSSKLYECSVGPTGEKLEIKPYGGTTGVVSFDARDGFGNQAACRKVVAYSHSGIFSSSDGGELIVPPGDYRCLTAVILPANTEANSDSFNVLVQRKSPVTVAPNETAVMTLGGPVDVVVDQESDIIEMKAGQEQTINMSLRVGDDDLVGLEGACKGWVNIRDEKGRLLTSGRLEISPDGMCNYCIRIPTQWKAGTYTMGVAFESALYQKPAYAHKMLRVGK